MAVEKRLKPAVIVQGMLFCGAAPLSSEITVAVEKRLNLVQVELLYKVCYSVVLPSQFRNNSGSREKIKTCSYCTRYVILWCCSSQFRDNSGSREKIKTCSYCTRYVILWCCPLSSEITVAVEKRLKPAVIVQGMLFCGAAPLSSE